MRLNVNHRPVRADDQTCYRATGPCRRRGLGYAPNLIGSASSRDYHINVTDGIAGDFGFVEDEMPTVLADFHDDGVMQPLFQCGTIRSCEPC